MFQLKRATMVVLVATFGILLPNFYIQLAQAEGEIEAELQAEAEHEAQPAAAAQGIKCYACNPCKDSKDLGNTKQCHPSNTYCAWGERANADGSKLWFRSCSTSKAVNLYSCDKFIPLDIKPEDKVRVCTCKGDLCNNKDSAGSTPPSPSAHSSSAQLLSFRILVAVSVVGLLMIK